MRTIPISRYFEIVYMLLNRRTITAAELAQHFEVSTRTIYRDINILSAAGIPVYSSKGNGGGISLLEGYSFNTSLLSGQEQDEMLMALQTLQATHYPEIEPVLGKLARLFKKEHHTWLDIDFSPWGSGQDRRPIFSLLRGAIMGQHVITFRYYNAAGKESKRTVEPVQLIFKEKSWYLSGYCTTSENFRLFKINRMKDIHPTDRTFEPRPVTPAVNQAEQQMESSSIAVTLRIGAKGAYRVYDEFPERMITVQENGSFQIQGDFPDGPWLDSYLLSFGVMLEGVQPESLRERLLCQLEETRSKLVSYGAS